jgi:phosphoserine phosphatase RsbU/P
MSDVNNDPATTGRNVPYGRGPERRYHDVPVEVDRRVGGRRARSTAWIPLFQGVDEARVKEALGDCEVRLLSTATPLLQPGQANHDVYILLSGELAAFLNSKFSADLAIPIKSGEFIGELSAIDGKPASALVVASSETRVLVIPGDVFWYRLMALPGMARNLMVCLSERVRRTNELTMRAQQEHLELVHLRKELSFARELQTSMLPLQRPMFPDRHDIEVCGLMEPASNVGGDLFDAFFVSDDELFFCIGDVSGHGVAAALFMARAVGLLRVLAMSTKAPDALLTDLNERLCVNNDTNLFVTMLCGFLNVRTGEVRYSNGGHCPPLHASPSGVRTLPIPKGPLIGALPGARYGTLTLQLAPDEVLFLYTDGVSEAQNAAGQEFSSAPCSALLQQRSTSLDAALESIRAAVATFTGTSALEDDCTMLALRRIVESKK